MDVFPIRQRETQVLPLRNKGVDDGGVGDPSIRWRPIGAIVLSDFLKIYAVFRFFSEDDDGAWKEKNSLARFFIFAP